MSGSVASTCACDVRVQVGDDPVDVAEHAGDVPVHVEDAVRVRRRRQLDLREVHRAGRRAGVDELDERRRRPRGRWPPAPRSVEPPMCGVRMTLGRPRSGGCEAVAVRLRLLGEDVDRGAGEVAALQRLGERGDVDDRAAARVEQVRALSSSRASSARADHVLRLRRLRDVQRDEVALGEQLVERRRPSGCCPSAACVAMS